MAMAANMDRMELMERNTTPTRLMRLFAVWLLLVTAQVAHAQGSAEKPLAVDGEIAADRRSVTLNWFSVPRTNAGAVTVKRRILGETGGDSWQTVGANLGTVFSYADSTTQPGVAYEYQVLRSGRSLIDVGYWATGVDLPLNADRGQAYLIVDETIAGPLADHIARFRRDLQGDGWNVTQRDIARHAGNDPLRNLEVVNRLRTWLAGQYEAQPDTTHAIILIGRVPVFQSGRINPDGHDAVPQPTDLYYADMDGFWRITAAGALIHNEVPGDAIEMQVGRIDFANYSDRDPAKEVQLLRSYFDKNHHWRHGLHGDLRTGYGSKKHLVTEVNTLRNIVGPDGYTEGGHHDVGEEQPWLWGVDFGDWNGKRYADAHAIKAIFTINFGSGKQHFAAPHNPMTAVLAQPWYPIAVGWGARPAWWLHHMALGGTIGDVHFRTVNNGRAAEPYLDSMDYFPTGDYLWRNPVWVNLLGDPTARAFPLSPPQSLTARATDDGVVLNWAASPDPDAHGFHIFRASKPDGMFIALNGDTPITETTFTDPEPATADAVYMVRAVGKKNVYAGSFQTQSQGIFAQVSDTVISAPTITLSGSMGQRIPLPEQFNAPENGIIHAVIAGPDEGRLQWSEGAWAYQPTPEFAGQIRFEYAASGAGQTVTGDVVIDIN